MAPIPIVFSLETGIYDSTAVEDAGKEVVLWTPQLGIFYSADFAAKNRYGLDIVEGDLRFFAADGSPLEANFSVEPRFNSNNTFFPGIYTLKSGTGINLQTALKDRIAANVSPHARIKVRTPKSNDSAANGWGWPDAATMRAGIVVALSILPEELAQRVDFEEF